MLCNLAYPRVFRQTQYGFDPNGQRVIRNEHGKIMIRVLWSKKQSEVVVVIKGSHSISDWLLNFAMWTRSCRRLGLNYRIHAGFYHLLFQESLPSRNEDRLGLTVIERLEVSLYHLFSGEKESLLLATLQVARLAVFLLTILRKNTPKALNAWSLSDSPLSGIGRLRNATVWGTKHTGFVATSTS